MSFELTLASFIAAMLLASFALRPYRWAEFIPFALYFSAAALASRAHFTRVQVIVFAASLLHVLLYYANFGNGFSLPERSWSAVATVIVSWGLAWIPRVVPPIRRLFHPPHRAPLLRVQELERDAALNAEDSVEEMREERRIAQTELRLLEAALPQHAFFKISTEGLVESWNESAQRIQGYTSSEILGTEVSVFYPSGQKHGGTLDSVFRTALQQGLHREEGWRLRQGGTPFWAETYTLPTFDSNGDLNGFYQIVHDASDRKKLERELRAAREAATSAEKAKTTFLANLNHEIRTPLGGMLGFSELMVNPHQSSADRADLLQLIKKNGEQLSNLIHDLLDLSRIESGREDIESVQFNFLDFMRDLSQRFRPMARSKGLRFDIVLETPMPEIVSSDPSRLRQILDNLLDNAMKFTDRGGVTLSLRLLHAPQSTAPTTAQLGFVVRDTGSGMNAEQRSRLFKPFMPGDSSTTRKFGGTGLGLALARGLARAMGGDLFLTESIPDRGSSFTLALPVGSFEDAPMIQHLPLEISLGENWAEMPHAFREASSQAAPQASTSATTPQPAPHLKPRSQGGSSRERKLDKVKILLVEDAADNQLLTSKFLRMEGATVEIANNGVEGVEKARGGDFDLILMDIQMPIQDGYEATSRLRRGGYKKPIIALTARAMKEERDRCIRSGCDDHITKPIDRVTLLKKILEHTHLPSNLN